MTNDSKDLAPNTLNSTSDANAALLEKLMEAATPGFQTEFDSDEALQAGAFVEDALSEQDAADSNSDSEIAI